MDGLDRCDLLYTLVLDFLWDGPLSVAVSALDDDRKQRGVDTNLQRSGQIKTALALRAVRVSDLFH